MLVWISSEDEKLCMFWVVDENLEFSRPQRLHPVVIGPMLKTKRKRKGRKSEIKTLRLR